MWRFWWVVVLTCFVGWAEARRQSPLMEEEAARKTVRAAECNFGGIPHELGSTWFADLGPPFGVMYCIKCECEQVQKKRRMVAKVHCRNIKNECPKLSCDEPVLNKGRCCKTCPEDTYSPDTPQDPPIVDDEKDARNFAALLLGNVRRPATIRFTLRRRSLHFSIEGASGTDGYKGARSLQVLDSSDNILQEVPIGSARLAGRICGVWRRLSRDYRRLLRDGRLRAALLWPGDSEPSLIGQIITLGSLAREMFSSLMEAEPGYGSITNSWGATAAIIASAGVAPSMHITLIFNGLLPLDESIDAPVTISLETIDKNTTVHEEDYHIRKPSKDFNIVEFSTPVTPAVLKLLMRGKLTLSIKSARAYSGGVRPILRGPVLPRLSCEHFYTSLSATSRAFVPLTSGVAYFYLSREGELIYNVQVDELTVKESPLITLVDETNKRHTELEDFSTLRNGIAKGSLSRMGPRVLESLYSGDLVVNVATYSDQSIIRGRLVSRPVSDVSDLNGPTLLKRTDLSKPANLVGLVWLSVDHDCGIQWEVSLSGQYPLNVTLELWLEIRPMIAPGAPVTSQRLGTLESPEGVMLSPSLMQLQRLHSGVSDFIIRDLNNNVTLLRAMLKPIKIPQSCLTPYTNKDTSVEAHPTYPSTVSNSIAECFDSGSFHTDGAQWTSVTEQCTMCSCLHGQVKCDAVVCPPLTCSANATIRPGECCATCSNSTLQDVNTSSTRGCRFAEQFYTAGQSWHPYLPPAGFDTCTICTCDSRTLVVQCLNTPCPRLNCPDTAQIRPDKNSCCKICSHERPEVIEKNNQKDEQTDDVISRQTPEKILAAGGCKVHNVPFKNGHEWHPNLHSLGEQKCVLCRCKDGNITCDRKKCTSRPMCLNQFVSRRRNHLKNAHIKHADDCCMQYCRRNRRHQKHHRTRPSTTK